MNARRLHHDSARLLTLVTSLAIVVCLVTASSAEPVEIEAVDSDGGTIRVPAEDVPTVLMFAMADQPRSERAMAQLKQVLDEAGSGTQVFAVVSGSGAGIKAVAVREATDWPWPIVPDADFALANEFGVHAWPTTVLVDAEGEEVAHLAGLPDSLAHDLLAYLAHTRGEIDADALNERLTQPDAVASDAERAADRQRRLAMHLLAQQQRHQARTVLEQALANRPSDPDLLLAMARVQLHMREPEAARRTLARLESGTISAWRRDTLKGWALVMLQRWPEAHDTLTAALRLNSEPSEAHYLLGRVEEQQGRWQRAVAHYRAAFEATAQGESLAKSVNPPGDDDAPQP